MDASNNSNSIDDTDIFREVISKKKPCYESSHTIAAGLAYHTPKHDEKLSDTLRDLYDNKLFSDVSICVKGKTFKSHRFLLCSSSAFFKGMFTSGLKETNEKSVEIKDVDPAIFEQVLEFLYTGTIELNNDNIQNMYEVAHMMLIPDLLAGCAGYLYKKMTKDNCLAVWNFAVKMSHNGVMKKARDCALKNINSIAKSKEFLELELSCLLELLRSDRLNVKTEAHAFSFANSWIEYNLRERKQHLRHVYRHIRLKQLSPNLLKDVTMRNENVRQSPECIALCENVLNCHVLNYDCVDLISQFPRLSTNRETCMLVFGGATEDGLDDEVLACSLQRPGLTEDVATLPGQFSMVMEDTAYRACIVRNDVFVIGNIEGILWKYSIPFKSWQMCEPCPSDVVGHGMVAIGDRIYILGGYLGPISASHGRPQISTNDVQEYDIAFNKWKYTGKLCEPTNGMVVVAYKNEVFLFCGSSINIVHVDSQGHELDIVQRFDTAEYKCYKESPLPTKRVSHAVVHDSKAILLADTDGCYVYDLTEKVVHSRPTFTLPVRRFGCFIANNQVYVAGGKIIDSHPVEQESKYADKIISCPVESIISGQHTPWFTEGTLGTGMIIDACVVVELEKLNDLQSNEVNLANIFGV